MLVPASLASGGRTAVAVVESGSKRASAPVRRTTSVSGMPECTVRLDRVAARHVLGIADSVADLGRLAVAGACGLADGALRGAGADRP